MTTRWFRTGHFRPLILTFLLLGMASPLAAQLRGISTYRSPRSIVAQDFLNKLETGRVQEAYQLLTAGARRAFPVSALKAPRRNPATFRRVTYEGPVSQYEVMQKAPGKYYIVCMVDAPRGGGATVHIAVTVAIEPPDSQWRVADYRYDSRQHPACASRV
jgi:hypothetical protein